MAQTKATAKTSSNGASAVETAPDIRGFELPRPQIARATLHAVGISPLICHRWSEKALKMLEDGQTGKAKAQKTARVPEEEAYAAAYVVPGRESWEHGKPGKYCFPAPAFKHAFLYGVSQLDDVKKFPKTKATGWVFVDGDPILKYDEMVLRSDTGRVGQGTSTMVYRPQFNGWSVDLDISFNANTITAEQVVALFDLGGTGGIGEWRPTSPKNKSGDFGRFTVEGITVKRSR
jgi:hypothetical protein